MDGGTAAAGAAADIVPAWLTCFAGANAPASFSRAGFAAAIGGALGATSATRTSLATTLWGDAIGVDADGVATGAAAAVGDAGGAYKCGAAGVLTATASSVAR